MLVKEVMTRNVVSVNMDQSVLEACYMYRDLKVGSLIVMDDEKCVGIVTERDLIERTICEHRDPETVQVKDIMSSNVITVHSLDNLEKALKIMLENNIKKLPVVDNKNIKGVITVTDISRAKPELSDRFVKSWVKPIWKD